MIQFVDSYTSYENTTNSSVLTRRSAGSVGGSTGVVDSDSPNTAAVQNKSEKDVTDTHTRSTATSALLFGTLSTLGISFLLGIGVGVCFQDSLRNSPTNTITKAHTLTIVGALAGSLWLSRVYLKD
jgi:hypothetical protein